MLLLIGAAITGVYGYYKWLPLLNTNTADCALKTDVDKQIATLNQRLNQITTQVSKLQESQTATLLSSPIASAATEDIQNQLEQFKQQINSQITALTAEISANEPEAVQPVTPATIERTPEILLASGAMIVRDMAENGLPFEYEAEVLQILAQHNEIAEKYVSQIQKYASSGIKGRASLIRAFNAFYPGLNEAPTTAQTDNDNTQKEATAETPSWQNKIWSWLKKMVVHKKKAPKPVFTAEQDEVYELVNAGKLAEAVNSLKTSDNYAKIDASVINQWENQVQDYLNFDRAINGLIMNSLANIRLKEMEH